MKKSFILTILLSLATVTAFSGRLVDRQVDASRLQPIAQSHTTPVRVSKIKFHSVPAYGEAKSGPHVHGVGAGGLMKTIK